MSLPRARLLLPILCGLIVCIGWQGSATAACAAPLPKDKGQDLLTINVVKDDSYRLWVRMYSPAADADALFARVDDTYCAILVGNSGKIPVKELTWVNYQDGDLGKPIDLQLTVGQHTIVLAGGDAGVGVDRLLLLADKDCVPAAAGDNCGDPTDVTVAQPTTDLGSKPESKQETKPATAKPKSYIAAYVAIGIAIAAVLVAAGFMYWKYWRQPSQAQEPRPKRLRGHKP